MVKPKDNEVNFNKCICESCTLYHDCNKEKKEKLFCGRKKSECEMDAKKMCICGMCPVYSENNLEGAYFCINPIAD